jgi:hypothetical protein
LKLNSYLCPDEGKDGKLIGIFYILLNIIR